MKAYFKKPDLLKASEDQNVLRIQTLLYDAKRKPNKKGVIEPYRPYYFCPYDQIRQVLEHTSVKGKYFCNEVVLENQPRKPVLDIEKTFKGKFAMETCLKHALMALMLDIPLVFKELYGVIIHPQDIIFLDCSRKVDIGYKLSLHVIVDAKGYHFVHGYEAKHFTTALMKQNPMYEDLIDLQMCNDAFCLRIAGAYKNRTEKVRLMPIDPITQIRYDLTDEILMRSLLTSFPGEKTRLVSDCIPKVETKVKTRTVNLVCHTGNAESKMFESLAKQIHPTAVWERKTQDMYHSFNYEDRSEPCPFQELETNPCHDSLGFYCYAIGNSVYMKCRSMRCKGMRLRLGSIKPDLTPRLDVCTQYLSNDEKVLSKVNDWRETGKCLAIKSPMGTGKTWLVKHVFAQYDPKRVLWITHRQTLTTNLLGTFEDCGFQSYLDIEGCLDVCDRLIVQLDSLIRIISKEFGQASCKPYDLIIMDEIESLLNHLGCEYLNSKGMTQKRYYDLLYQLCFHTPKVLMLDADLSVRAKVFASQFATLMIYNLYLRPRRFYHATNDIPHFYQQMGKSLDKGENIAVVSMSASEVVKISHWLQKRDIPHVAYTSETGGSEKSKLAHVNQEWIKYRVVLYSPTIEAGVDFTAVHFDRIFGVISSARQTCSARSFLQMVGRIRNVKSRRILCLYEKMLARANGEPLVGASLYTYKDAVKCYKVYGEVNKRSVLHYEPCSQIIDGRLVFGTKQHLSVYDRIMILNQVETMNKNDKQTAAALRQQIELAGDVITFEYVKPPPAETGKPKHPHPVDLDPFEEKVKALVDIDVDQYQIHKLQEKQRHDCIETDEKVALHRHALDLKLNLIPGMPREMVEEIIRYHLKNQPMIKLTEVLFNYGNVRDYFPKPGQSESYSQCRKQARFEIMKDLLITFLGPKLKDPDKAFSSFEHFPQDIRFNQSEYNKAIARLKDAKYFQNEQEHRALFSQSKMKPLGQKRDKLYYCKVISSMLRRVGMRLKREQTTIKNVKKYSWVLLLDKKLHVHLNDMHFEPELMFGDELEPPDLLES